MSDGRIRWRMTLDQLCHAAQATPIDIERWAQLGAYGPRWKEPRDRGKYRHITREMAQRAVVMSRLVRAGLKEEHAAQAAVLHERGRDTDLHVKAGPVEIVINREQLP